MNRKDGRDEKKKRLYAYRIIGGYCCLGCDCDDRSTNSTNHGGKIKNGSI